MKDSLRHHFDLFFVSLFMCVIFTSCRDVNRTNHQSLSKIEDSVNIDLAKNPWTVPIVPGMIVNDEERINYLKYNFWNNFPFDDSLFSQKKDSAYMVQYFAAYSNILSDDPDYSAPVYELMKKASVSKSVLDFFAWSAEMIWNDPNSFNRNDEFYIPVLKAQIESGFYDDAQVERLKYKLKLASLNRLGTKANDITYTIDHDTSGRLYEIPTKYTLLFINNPGCQMCDQVINEMKNNSTFEYYVSMDIMTVLAIYPDEDLSEWKQHQSEIPCDWINGYDKGCNIRKNCSYNLSAIPALYLLNKNKNVLLKDETNVQKIVDYISNDNESLMNSGSHFSELIE